MPVFSLWHITQCWGSLRSVFHGIFVLHRECILWLMSCDALSVSLLWLYTLLRFCWDPSALLAEPFQDGARLAPLPGIHVLQSASVLLGLVEVQRAHSGVFSFCLFSRDSCYLGGQSRFSQKLSSPILHDHQSWTKVLLFLYASGCAEALSSWLGVLHGGRGGRVPPFPSPWKRDWEIYSHEFL